jgi:hypothetical protein
MGLLAILLVHPEAMDTDPETPRTGTGHLLFSFQAI